VHQVHLAARVVELDRRAIDTFRELVNVQWEHALVVAHERAFVRGTFDRRDGDASLKELEQAMRELERALDERPWTEV
jgi:hypothetical protein